MVTVNGIGFAEVWIDPHYEVRHGDTITDNLILELVRQLEARPHSPESIRDDGYQFYVSDVWYLQKPYRLVWIAPPGNGYLGVRTAFRRSK